MKLHIVKAQEGISWLKLAYRILITRQIFGMVGLFAAGLSVSMFLGWVPGIGVFLSLATLPILFLVLMVGSQHASNGIFPSLTIVINIWKNDKAQNLTLIKLGLLYAVSLLLLTTINQWIGGQALQQWLNLPETLAAINATNDGPVSLPPISSTVLFSVIFGVSGFLLISLTFWHAPGLVYWYKTPLFKSLFFSLVACLQNWRAYFLFGLANVVLVFIMTQAVILLSVLLGAVPFGLFLLLAILFQTIINIASYYAFCSMFGTPSIQ